MKNFKLKPSICIASPDYCKNICPPDTNCGMRRFINKYGFNYLPNYSRQTKPETQLGESLSNAMDGRERSFIMDKTADTHNLESEMFIGSMKIPLGERR